MGMPIRVRLTLGFALAMAIVLAVGGYFLYARLGHSLDRAIGQGLHSRAADVAALVQQADSGLSDSRVGRASDLSAGFAQVLDTRGQVFDETPGLGRTPLLQGAALSLARKGPTTISRALVYGESVRLFALPVTAQGEPLVVVVGTSLEARSDALAGLRSELLVGGPIGLLLTSLIGYGVATAALRPVERMRARAAEISTSQRGQRLPAPARRDELGRLGETLNDMLARLQLGFERERTFVSDASHELRTPLALLKTEIELALEEPRSKRELQAALRSAGEETDRLAQLADDLLLLARLDKGLVPLRSASIPLDDLFERVAQRFVRRASENERTIVCEGRGIEIMGDSLRLEQALGNLVDNALRHGRGTVRIKALERDGWVDLHVSDDGDGFPSSFSSRAFERFSQADADRPGAGAGLGLAIVEEVARAHGGVAKAESRPAGGADVWLSLPSRGNGRPGQSSTNEPAPASKFSDARHETE